MRAAFSCATAGETLFNGIRMSDRSRFDVHDFSTWAVVASASLWPYCSYFRLSGSD
jgi:hypothetical protein